MAITIKSSILNYSGTPSLTAEVSAPDGTTVLNGAGSGSSVTAGSRFSVSFTFSDTISPGLYEVRYVNSGNVYGYGTVWIEASSGTFNVNDKARLAAYQEQLARNLESPIRDVADLRVVEFDWPAGATFTANSSTRIFPGQTSTAPLSGAITAVRSGRYKIAYNIADRAADATTIVPTEVLYRLIDDNGNSGDLTLRIVEQASFGNGVTPTIILSFDPLTKTIGLVRSDAYLTSLGTAINIAVNIPSGVDANAISGARLGANHRHKSSTLVGNVTLEEIDSQWTAIIEFPMSATAGKDLGEYAYDVEITYNSQDVTILSGSLRLIQDYSTHV